MKTANIAHTKSHLSTLIAQAEAGEEVVITRRGKPVARLVAEPSPADFGWPELQAWVAQAPVIGPSVAEMREQDLL